MPRTLRPRKPANLRGLVSGRLVAVRLSPIRKSKNYYWHCICRCGRRADVRATLLIRSLTKSCGCLGREVTARRQRKHGLGRTPLAAVWRNMIARCHNPKAKAYPTYGARGITVCERWRDSLESFLEDMGPRPDGYDIDRQDNAGNYEPGNCRWVPRKANQRNRRDNVLLTHDGATKTLAEWAEITGIKYGTIWKRLKLGWPVELALAARASEPQPQTHGAA
jgi:hypothetical protein